MTLARANGVSRILKSLADPVRLRLVSLVLAHEGGEACATCDLAPGFDLSQPTLSHHLKVLHESGILDREKRGVWVYYRVCPETMQVLRTLFNVELAPDVAKDATGGCTERAGERG